MDKNIYKKTEFDVYASEYSKLHSQNISISGEGPEYFSEYKVKDMALYFKGIGKSPDTIIDFGCGIGGSLAFLKKYFTTSMIYGCDVSSESISVAREMNPDCKLDIVNDNSLPYNADFCDVVFCACVFHHIDQHMYEKWLTEIRRVLKVGGHIVIYEHNPYNPLTVRAVNTCPFDENAVLITPNKLGAFLKNAGFNSIEVKYVLFFPRALKFLRFLEKFLWWLPLGAQYRVSARAP